MDKQDKAKDNDQLETQEWLDALESALAFAGKERADYLLQALNQHASVLGLTTTAGLNTPYSNTIATDEEAKIPENHEIMESLTHYMRWNAIAMVMRAVKELPELGGHLSTYGSSASLFEVGLNYFFHAPSQDHGGDLVYFQGHASPGLYARAYLEGRLTAEQIGSFRQEIFKGGVSSYPHPWLMPDFWQFPTVSMGLGPLSAIYQAQFLKYLQHRGLAETANRHVWAFCGDGEMGEPESLGALNIAARDRLDNLVFVISCNLQRLDGPVSGNSQIIQEYEGVFRGAGWNVIKVIWGGNWEELFARDTSGKLMQRVSELIDGEYQAYTAKDGAYMREHFFGKYPELLELVSAMSDDDLQSLTDGGHDLQKIYAAYHAAVEEKEKPTVILAKTVKGYGMGAAAEGLNTAHNVKKISVEARKYVRDRFNLPLSDKQIEELEFLPLPKGSKEEKFLHAQRKALGGYLPARSAECEVLPAPPLSSLQSLLDGSGEREISSTMAFVRILGALLKDANIKQRIVPIVADETRTFGMEGLFRQIGIYAPFGQQYTPVDKEQLMYYRETETGQLMQQGLSEPGAMATWIAAATSYVHSDVPMIPFYIYYSMFGFQRIGDLAWSAGDAGARGFIIGGTAGRTTLAGEGLQHQDGHNLIMFSMIPNCVSYDPCYAYEMAVIIQDGLRRMYENQEHVFYYITAMNENYVQPAMPKGVEQGIVRGMYPLRAGKKKAKAEVVLLGSGTILREVLAAAEQLEADFDVSATVWSVTSFNELRKDSESAARQRRLHPTAKKPRQAYVAECLGEVDVPIVAATDYMKLCAEQIRQDINAPYYVLGTDGYGRSDTRAALREFFEVNAAHVVYTALVALADAGTLSHDVVKKAQKKLGIDPKRADPTTV